MRDRPDWIVRLTVVSLVVSLPHPPAAALAPGPAARLVSAARELVGVRYQLGGRMRRTGEGIDCQGVLFYAAQRVRSCGWRSYSVFPTRSVADGELGRPVAGMAPVSTAELDVRRLEPGDVVLLVAAVENPKEPSIGVLDGTPVWVWHTGLYTGEGEWVNADFFSGEVTESSLEGYLREHADAFDGVFVTRMEVGPRPRRCRRHPPMSIPRTTRSD